MEEHCKIILTLQDLESLSGSHHGSLGDDFTDETREIAASFINLRPSCEILILNPGDIHFNFGKKVSAKFVNAEKMALFVATLGPEASEIINSFREDPFSYYAADHLASLYAEALADFVHKKAESIAVKMGMKISNRYSPGYCGWRVSDQKLLFAAFPGSPCNVKLTEGSLMYPVKSVSGVVAMGRKVSFEPYGCETCSDKCLNKLIKEI